VRTQRSEQSNLILQRALQNLHPHARLLLLRSDGKAWSATSADHRRPFENAVKRAGLDARTGLRPRNRIRQLNHDVPVAQNLSGPACIVASVSRQ
jgi:hypothetical protein